MKSALPNDVTLFMHLGNPYSAEANKSVKQDKARLRSEILNLIASSEHYGATSDEIEQETGYAHQTVSARFTELKLLNLIVQQGTRPTRSGRNAGVWVVKEQM